MTLLGVDAGTTHSKAGIFTEDGEALRIASRNTQTQRSPAGFYYYDPELLWQGVVSAIEEVLAGIDPREITAVGIASMAETGLLVDRKTGAPRSVFIPWFDTSAGGQAEILGNPGSPWSIEERFLKTGIRPSYKCSLAKLLWLRERGEGALVGLVWLSAADYIAYRLTGELGTDYSLAGRTYAFRIDTKEWDKEWLEHWGFTANLFPPPGPSGKPVGGINSRAFSQIGLAKGTPVSISGHDHLCAAFAAGAARPGGVFDSLGTAETLVGAIESRPLGRPDYLSGLSYGCHVKTGLHYWMGGISASGGSIEWLRSLLGEPPLTYPQLAALLEDIPPEPGELLYFPHLAGRGSPYTDPSARGALIGLKASHGRGDILRAVLEGTAYEMEAVRRAAEQATGLAINPIVASGGGTRNRRWMQIKADVSGSRLEILAVPEATLYGAALLAGAGCGVSSSSEQPPVSLVQPEIETYLPDDARHAAYQCLFEQGYLPLQEALKPYYHWRKG